MPWIVPAAMATRRWHWRSGLAGDCTDFTEADLDLATQRARQQNLNIDFRACDMRLLGEFFQSSFHWVVTCTALDNIAEEVASYRH